MSNIENSIDNYPKNKNSRRVKKLRTRIYQLEQQIETQNNIISRQDTQIVQTQKYTSEKKQLQREISKKNKEIERLGKRSLRWSEKIDNQELDIAHLNRKLDKANAKILRTEEDRDQCKIDLNIFEKRMVEIKQEINQCKADLEHSQYQNYRLIQQNNQVKQSKEQLECALNDICQQTYIINSFKK